MNTQQDATGEANRKPGKTRSKTGKNLSGADIKPRTDFMQAVARVAFARSSATKRSSALEARKSHTADAARQLASAANGRDPFPGGNQ